MNELNQIIKALPLVKADTEAIRFAKGGDYLKRKWPFVVADILFVSSLIYVGWLLLRP